MIEYINGDITKATEKIIIHGCNAQGVMGSGVAKYIRTEYPEAYSLYRYRYENAGLSLGEIIWVYTKGKWIGNAITQEFYGRDNKKYVSYDAVDKVTKTLNTIPIDYDIAMSMIGSNLGGGNWNIISSIIENNIPNKIIKVYCFQQDYDKWLTTKNLELSTQQYQISGLSSFV